MFSLYMYVCIVSYAYSIWWYVMFVHTILHVLHSHARIRGSSHFVSRPVGHGPRLPRARHIKCGLSYIGANPARVRVACMSLRGQEFTACWPARARWWVVSWLIRIAYLASYASVQWGSLREQGLSLPAYVCVCFRACVYEPRLPNGESWTIV